MRDRPWGHSVYLVGNDLGNNASLAANNALKPISISDDVVGVAIPRAVVAGVRDRALLLIQRSANLVAAASPCGVSGAIRERSSCAEFVGIAVSRGARFAAKPT